MKDLLAKKCRCFHRYYQPRALTKFGRPYGGGAKGIASVESGFFHRARGGADRRRARPVQRPWRLSKSRRQLRDRSRHIPWLPGGYSGWLFHFDLIIRPVEKGS